VNARSPQLVDFHNHVIPGVDDGAQDEAEALHALQAFAAQGVGHIIATPHIDGSLTTRPDKLGRRLEQVDAGFALLQRVAVEHCPDVVLYRGAEVMLDTPEPDIRDDRLRLAGGPFVLVEYPFMNVPPNSAGVIRTMIAGGAFPIIAHPERYIGMSPTSRLPMLWREAGALLQVNAGSLTGRYGSHARASAMSLLARGLADYVCSDFHARGRPATKGALAALAELGASEQADLLIRVNPRRLLAGQQPLPVPPLHARHGMLNRLKRWLR
jgi:protein-tyrosine phosphatase